MKYDDPVIHRNIEHISTEYFSYLAKTFPVMCASDEFHFMPRAEEAEQYYDMLDPMEVESMHDCIRRLKSWKHDIDSILGSDIFYSMEKGTTDRTVVEDYTDLLLLASSISALLIEFEYNKSWKHNPLLYLKIAFIGIDHALGKPAFAKREMLDRTKKRLQALPLLLETARANLDGIPELYHQGAMDMIEDCTVYLGQISKNDSHSKKLVNAAEQAARALASFRNHLMSEEPDTETRSRREVLLEKTIVDHFQTDRDIQSIMNIARKQWDDNLQHLKELELKIGSGESWQELYRSVSSGAHGPIETLQLYRSEYKRLFKHFSTQLPFQSDHEPPLCIVDTPRYLRSIRGSASFAASFSRDMREKSFFYITTVLPHVEESTRLSQRLHREHLFLTAHETVPGHHYLDNVRRGINNAVRRQYESPLFYEGWATYAESLLLHTGYVKEDLNRIVFHKRNLWRAARCLVDLGLATGSMSKEESQKLLEQSGFNETEAVSQMRRFQLNPGYQLCYSLGLYEILKLKEKHATLLGNDRFHQLLLDGGQAPFSLIDFRMQFLTEKPERGSG